MQLFDCFFSGNQKATSSTLSIANTTISSFANTTPTIFSFSTTSTTTATTISLLSSTTQVTIVMQNENFDNVQRQNDHQISDHIKTSTKLFLILFVLYILFVLFKWKNIQRRNSLKILLVPLLSFVVTILCIIVLI
jgi:hypothetical protein